MTVNGLDHVNIRTVSMSETVRFFTDVLELTAGPPITGLDPARYTWIYDGTGRALFHLDSAPARGSGDTGSLDHVALDCSGHDAMTARLDRLGIAYRCNHIVASDLKQVFVTEPNGILLELNFRSGHH